MPIDSAYTSGVTLLLGIGFPLFGYLFGSISLAIIVTRLATGHDIRSIGNGNAGTANVARNVGKGYAAIVFVGDVAKVGAPMYLAALLLPHGAVAAHWIVTAVGVAAVVGHCRPVFFGFRGGGGFATSFGAIGFAAPAEIAISMLVGFVLAELLVRTSEYRLGRWTSGFILLIAPVVVTVSRIMSRALVPVYYGSGVPTPHLIAGTWVIAFTVILINRATFFAYVAGLFRRG